MPFLGALMREKFVTFSNQKGHKKTCKLHKTANNFSFIIAPGKIFETHFYAHSQWTLP